MGTESPIDAPNSEYGILPNSTSNIRNHRMTSTPKKIAFQGEFGANSHMACIDMFPDMEPVPCRTFEDAFSAISHGDTSLAMIPIENTLAGRVADIHHLLPESNLNIVGEYFMPIHFQLMVIPGTSIEQIKTVHSHVHALGQCRNIVRDRGWRGVIADDTAGAAKEVAAEQDRSRASLSPTLAAELYGLEILEQNVEDSDNNVTRFIVLSPDPVEIDRNNAAEKIVTTFVFNVRNIPAALYKAMGGFATNGINITKLESYQLGGKFTATQFYADIEGHPDDGNVKLALEELQFFSEKVKFLGSYQAHPFRN